MSTCFNVHSHGGLASPSSLLLNSTTFLVQTKLTYKTIFKIPSPATSRIIHTFAKFNLYEILGGRGLCNGEERLQQELEKTVEPPPPPTAVKIEENTQELAPAGDVVVPEDGFGKELLGLTGGFPGGEKGLRKFIEQNPPPKKTKPEGSVGNNDQLNPKSAILDT